MTTETIAGLTYAVTSPAGGAVTDENGLTLGTVAAGTQQLFVATGGRMICADNTAVIVLVLNR